MIQALLLDGDQRTLIAWPAEKDRWLSSAGVVWIDVQAPSPAEMEGVAADLGLSPIVVKACLNSEHRARLKELKGHLLLVLNGVGRGPSESGHPSDLSRWRALELNIVAGERFVVTVHPHVVTSVSLLFQRWVREGEGRAQVSHLLHSIAESVTLGYYVLLDRIDLKIDEVENAIFAGNPGPHITGRLFVLKKHVLYLRRVLGPQRDALGALMRREFPMISPEARPYFLEVYEHTLRLFDLLETYRDLISSSLDAYLSIVSNRMNEIMKILTIVSTIMLPLTLISGIFGMNFAGIPLSEAPGGFWILTGTMALIGLGMTYYFRRRGWF